jgi:hypothetical protein
MVSRRLVQRHWIESGQIAGLHGEYSLNYFYAWESHEDLTVNTWAVLR